MNCFDNIIGISRTENECFSEEFSAEAQKSNSGLYLDEQIEGFPSLDVFKSLASHDQTTLELLLKSAVSDAKLQFTEELYKNLGTMYTVKEPAYVGNVGNNSYSSVLSIGHAFAGVVFDMAQFIGAEVYLTGIKPYFDYTGTVTVKLYRAYNTGIEYQIIEELTEFVLNTHVTAPSQQSVTAIPLAATDESGKAYSYIFVYEVESGKNPRDNKTSCGCGNKEDLLFKYLRPYGVAGTAASNLLIANRTDRVNGLQVFIQARCTGGDFVCQEYYNNPMVKTVIEWQILRKAASIAIVKILTTDLVNHYTMGRREQLGQTVHILNSKFKNNMQWLAENIHMFSNECFSCNYGGSGEQELTKGGILL